MNKIKNVQIMIDRTFPLVESWYYAGADQFGFYVDWVKGDRQYSTRKLYDMLVNDTIYDFYDDTIMIQSILAADFSEDLSLIRGYLNTAEYLFMEHDSKFGGLEFGALKINEPISGSYIKELKKWISDAYSFNIDPIPLIIKQYPWINWVVTSELNYTKEDYKYPTYSLNEKPIIVIEQNGGDVQIIICNSKGEKENSKNYLYSTWRDKS